MTIKQKLGRPVSEKTVKVRRSVRNALRKHGVQDGTPIALSTVEVARLARQSKTKTIFALRYFESVGVVKRTQHRAEAKGAGQPPQMWIPTNNIFD